MSTIVSSLLYAGLDRDKMRALLPEARAENGHYLAIYSSMTAMIFAICLLVSYIAGGKLVVNRPIYIILIVVGFALYLSTKTVLPLHPGMSTVLAVIFIIALYGYSFTVSLLHSDMQGAAAVAILLVMPALFNYRPVYMIAMTLLALCVYCLLSAQLKEHSIAMLDLWNCLFFGSIAVLLSVFQMRVKFRLLLQKRENRYLSETDLLTGAKNRNCFENRRERYARNCRVSVSCAFIDANGLHELNDTRGHEEGDRMLQTVAKAVMRAFGPENTYRIGGDEFITLCADIPAERVQDKVRDIERAVGEAGYSVSVGVAHQSRDGADMRLLIKEAETSMYSAKQRYYEQGGHDRRKRAAAKRAEVNG